MLCVASWLHNRGFPNKLSSVLSLTGLYFHHADYSAFVWLGIASEQCSPNCRVPLVYAIFYVVISVIVPFYSDCRSLSYWTCDSGVRSSLLCSTGGHLLLFHCCVFTVLAVVGFPWNLLIVYSCAALTKFFQWHLVFSALP
jgi:hypothetical protein